jgi:hypothetical protein
MAKTKSQAAWNGLSVKQRRTLEEWLFEEGLSYNEALARAKKELGFKGQRSSVRRFYEERNRERTLLGFAAAGKMLTAVAGAPVSQEDLRDAGMKVAAQVFFKLVTERPEQAKDWLPLAKLLAQGERSAAWREVKDAENEIRRAALDFARTKHQYDMIGQALKAMPELEEMAEAQRDPEVTKYERNRRMNDLRKQMFGESIPELLPETPEEEADPELVERKMEEAKQRQNEEWARQQVEIQKENAELRRRELEAKRPGAGKGGGGENEEKDERENDDDPPSPGSSGAAGKLAPKGAESGTEKDSPAPGGVGAAREEEAAPDGGRDTAEPFVDEPRKLTPEERERNYRELMRRARGG